MPERPPRIFHFVSCAANNLAADDVNDDFSITAYDVLLITNYINAQYPSEFPPDVDPDTPYVDTTGDNHVAPDDVLDVINYINLHPHPGEGEATPRSSAARMAATSTSPPLDPATQDGLLLLLAPDTALQPKGRLV